MVHNTPSRRQARKLREKAKELQEEAVKLAGIEGLESEAASRQEKAKEQIKEAERLVDLARIEDLRVREVALTKKPNKKGETKTYYRWICSWRDGDKIITKYLGSSNRMNKRQAEEKARKMKAEALRLREQDD
jgi:hypothetical protein